MAGLNEESKWENEIYRVEENDPVVGGEDGTSNKPQKQLANRTLWLKTKVEELFNKGKPKKITGDTTNAVDADGHTHEIERASTSKRGITQLTDSINFASSLFAASALAVKTAYDKAVAAYDLATSAVADKVSKAGDAMSGILRAADFVLNRNGNQKLSSIFDALIKLAQGNASGFQSIVNTWGNAGTTPLGVTYNFTNANAWYICMGPIFGNLIIQGVIMTTTLNETVAVTLPISYKTRYIPIGDEIQLRNVTAFREHNFDAWGQTSTLYVSTNASYRIGIITIGF
ncbi:phage tail protein [Gallibacterium salpingitidis]|uniref:phage tail protein n=1 Tax=Gallibacterium salpingitidis TaxID=505341 RepID=UPI00083539D8|nr:phage tail protein [Gallibacterium salpingitidis]